MKKVFATIILAIFVFSPISTVWAQKIRTNSQLSKKPEVSAQIRRADAFSDGRGVWLRFQTENDANVIGYNVYRIEGKTTLRVNSNMLPGGYFRIEQSPNTGKEYALFDDKGGLQSTYLIERVDLNGQIKRFDPFYTRYIGDLTYVAGMSSEELLKSASEAQPIIEKTSLVLPKTQGRENIPTDSLTNPTAQKWVAGQPGVKIGVQSEGIYRVSRAQLEAAGFDVNAAPNVWQLYLNGVEQAIIVGPNGDYIEFYGRNEIDTYRERNADLFSARRSERRETYYDKG